MTKPGYHPWAKDDVWTAGPDVGSDTKAAPPDANRDEGYYRQRRPGPDVLNWQLNRNALIHETLARMQAMNYQFVASDATNYNGGFLRTACHYNSTTTPNILYTSLFFHDSPGPDTMLELYAQNGHQWTAPASNPVFGALVAPTYYDSDGGDTLHRILVITDSSAADLVKYATGFGGGAWTTITFGGGAPTYQWASVACDRNTAGGASADWCIGCYTGAGTSPEIWSSTDGINFATEAGFSAGNGERVVGLYHSKHRAGLLGPDDPGNPVWVAVLDTDDVYRSVDHATWNGPVALGKNTGGNARSLAYSAPARRWVAAHSDTDFGDISYSDDNGASWTTLANVLQASAGMQAAGMEAHITGDGYGTFIVTRYNRTGLTSGNYFWISVDDGLTWSLFEPEDDTIAAWTSNDGYIIEACFPIDSDVDGTANNGGFYIYAGYRDAGPQTRIFKSLIV